MDAERVLFSGVTVDKKRFRQEIEMFRKVTCFALVMYILPRSPPHLRCRKHEIGRKNRPS